MDAALGATSILETPGIAHWWVFIYCRRKVVVGSAICHQGDIPVWPYSEENVSVPSSTLRASVYLARIWVGSQNGRQGIATQLLSQICRQFHVQRSEVAFSQPTEPGLALARRFTESRDVLVYI
jgi:hypothetical protein